jgi:hypothetical protein
VARDLDVLRAKARAQDSAALAEEEELTKTHWTNQHVNQATSPLGLADYWADLERVQPGAAAIAWEQVFSNCDPFASSFLPNDPTLGPRHEPPRADKHTVGADRQGRWQDPLCPLGPPRQWEGRSHCSDGRSVVLYHRSFTSYQTHEHIRCLCC